MNYQRIHDEIICHAKSRILPKDTYKESHHIIPKCLGGTNDKSNLVNLTAREHYIIHWLLYKIHKFPSLGSAWHALCMSSTNTNRRYTSHTFEYARKANAKYQRIINTGKILSEETKKKLRGRTPHNKGKTGLFVHPNKGGTVSDQQKSCISNMLKERWKDPEYRAMMCAARKGRVCTDNTKNKLSVSLKAAYANGRKINPMTDINTINKMKEAKLKNRKNNENI